MPQVNNRLEYIVMEIPGDSCISTIYRNLSYLVNICQTGKKRNEQITKILEKQHPWTTKSHRQPNLWVPSFSEDRQLALHYAAANGHAEVVKILVRQDSHQLMWPD